MTLCRVEAGEFEGWYREAHPRLLGSMVLITGSIDEARECVDEALARALAQWSRVSSMATPVGWTYRVAVNLAHRRARRRAMEMALLRRRGPERIGLDGPAGEAWAEVANLPARQREVVALRYIGDLTEVDIAATLGISRSTVSSTLADAHRALARQLADQHPRREEAL